MAVKTLQDLISEGVAGRHILVRSDFNVPLNEAGEITDAGRITASLPTIKALSEAGAKVILMAHLGRPKGQVNPKFSLAPVATALTGALGQYVALAGDVVGEDAHERANGLTDGDVLLLENVRFDPRETSKDEAERGAFADQLVALAADNGAFVSDGFGVVHRAQASVYDVAQRLPHYAGGLVQKEIDVLKKVAEAPERPYVVVLGGAKVSDKLGVIQALAQKADKVKKNKSTSARNCWKNSAANSCSPSTWWQQPASPPTPTTRSCPSPTSPKAGCRLMWARKP